jgi:hypothetical protein
MSDARPPSLVRPCDVVTGFMGTQMGGRETALCPALAFRYCERNKLHHQIGLNGSRIGAGDPTRFAS